LSAIWRRSGTAFAEAAIDGGVAAAREVHDLLVAVAEALEVEHFALAGLERLHGLQAVVVLDVVERLLVGAALVGVGGLGPFAGLALVIGGARDGAGGLLVSVEPSRHASCTATVVSRPKPRVERDVGALQRAAQFRVLS